MGEECDHLRGIELRPMTALVFLAAAAPAQVVARWFGSHDGIKESRLFELDGHHLAGNVGRELPVKRREIARIRDVEETVRETDELMNAGVVS